jgi:hypothetical protein
MSELHHRYDRTAVTDRITQPPFADLTARSRRRVHRARTARLAAVAMLAALVAAPLLALRGGSQPDTAGPPGSARGWAFHDVIVNFLDLRHGVAQYLGEACGEGWVAVTEDSGTTWSELRALPKVPDRYTDPGTDGAAVCIRPGVFPIASDTLVMQALVGPDPADRTTFISHDAGRTWREYQPRVRSADSVPDGMVPWWSCDEVPCHDAGLGWYDAATGDWMVLRNQPPRDGYVAMTVAFDGSMWVYGSGRDGDGDFRLAVSRDRGRSWQDRTPAADIDWLATSGLVAHDGDTAYLYPMDSPKTNPFEVYRTIDGGETWQRVSPAHPLEEIVFVWVNRDGGLGVADRDRNQYLSADGGRTFARTELPAWGPSGITGGLQGWPIDYAAADPVDLYLSEDGLTWRPVQIPYYQRP